MCAPSRRSVLRALCALPRFTRGVARARGAMSAHSPAQVHFKDDLSTDEWRLVQKMKQVFANGVQQW